MIETCNHRSFTFLYIILLLLFILLFINGVTSDNSQSQSLSTINPIDDGLRQFDGINSTLQGTNENDQSEGRLFFKNSRLFGARRRIQFALLPIMFKLGVISTMLVGLTVMMLKGLTIGVILLFFALGNSLLKYKFHQPQQPVHFHLHPSEPHHSVPIYHHGYGHSESWDKASEQSDSVPGYENYDPGSIHKVIPIRYPYRYPNYAYHGK